MQIYLWSKTNAATSTENDLTATTQYMLQPKAAAIPTRDPKHKTGSWTSKALGHPQLPGWHRLLQGCPIVPLNLGGVGTV